MKGKRKNSPGKTTLKKPSLIRVNRTDSVTHVPGIYMKEDFPFPHNIPINPPEGSYLCF